MIPTAFNCCTWSAKYSSWEKGNVRVIVIGSRGSQLALWQARHIAACLRERGVETRLEIIKTTGDKITDVPLAQVGGKGLFTKEIEEALLAGTIDLAVHSLKDMPTALPDGLTLAAIPPREDPRDALIGRPLAELGRGDKIGTSSLRRAAQLHALGRGFAVETLRGNVDTRLRKLDEGQYGAIVLAAAGLNRLGWAERIRELLDTEVMCPAVGQGALAIETRADGGPAHTMARTLNDPGSETAVTAERSLLATLEGGCQVPIGAHARIEGDTIHLQAIVASPDGSRMVRDRATGHDPAALGRELGERLLASGAREILAS
jgi:hydroxymethylbilane synthase